MRSRKSISPQAEDTVSRKAGIWCLAAVIVLAPLLFGSVTSEAQGLLGCLLAVALFLVADDWRISTPLLPRWLKILAVLGLLICIVPLPVALLKILSPARAQLALNFPLTEDQTPFWSSATFSPALSLRWIWQVTLLVMAYFITRQAVRRSGATTWLTVALGAGILSQVGAELFYRGEAQKLILGIWPIRWGNSAGTFANRNHYADWLVVASLVLGALAVRYSKPLRSARPDGNTIPKKKPWKALLLLVVAAVGVTFAVMSGSRGGAVALLLGAGVFALALRRHSASSRRRLWLVLAALVVGLVALQFAGLTLQRLSNLKDETAASYPKWRLWGDALRGFLHYPLTGTGPGTFVRANILLKTVGGDSTAWHAENDYLQWISETGLWGLVFMVGAAVCLWRKIGRWFLDQKWRTREPELFLGALAGLAAMTAHALIDFPFQVTANALLAAVLFGVLSGLWESSQIEQEFRLASPARIRLLTLLAPVLLVIGGLQVAGFYFWRQSQLAVSKLNVASGLENARASLHWWPLAVERVNPWLRLEVSALPEKSPTKAEGEVKNLRTQFSGYLQTDPLNWELRLERAWLDITFSQDWQTALTEAYTTMKLNPRQALIPLRFAAALMERDPHAAWDFLEAADVSQGQHLVERLDLAWKLKPDATQMWPLVPANDKGYEALATFAFGHKLPVLAAQAYKRMKKPLAPAEVARRFLDNNRPDLAREVLPPVPGNDLERVMLARVTLMEGDGVGSLRVIEPLLQRSDRRSDFLQPAQVSLAREALAGMWSDGKRSPKLALQLAESEMSLSPDERNAGLMQQLAATYPKELHLQWLCYQTWLDRHEYAKAAQAAVKLAEEITGD